MGKHIIPEWPDEENLADDNCSIMTFDLNEDADVDNMSSQHGNKLKDIGEGEGNDTTIGGKTSLLPYTQRKDNCQQRFVEMLDSVMNDDNDDSVSFEKVSFTIDNTLLSYPNLSPITTSTKFS